MTSVYYLATEKKNISGSAKVKGHEQAVVLHRMLPYVVRNDVAPQRAAQRKSAEPDFSSVAVQSLLGKDVVHALHVMAQGATLGKATITKVQSNHVDAMPETEVIVGDSYVRFWGLSFVKGRKGEKMPLGTGCITTYEIVGNAFEVKANHVGQNEQAEGTVAAAFSRVNQMAK